MSHPSHRKEINCLNCGTTVMGPFCHECGQENLEPKESIWHLIGHFFNDLTHFDGKFFVTLKDLLFKPGFLTREYTLGKRVSYLNPVKMYFFTSALFFFIFFSVYNVEKNLVTRINTPAKSADSLNYDMYTKLPHTGPLLTKEQYLSKRNDIVTFTPGQYRSKAAYDSLLASGKKKHNWLERQLIYKNIEIKQKYAGNKKLFVTDMVSKFFHLLPQMFFILLPIFALILKLFYIRKPDVFYTDHIIFTIHFYIFLFIALLAILSINRLGTYFPSPILNYLADIIYLLTFFYFYKAMRNFYKQGRIKTIIKYSLILFTGFMTTLFMFVIFVSLSIFEI